MSISPTSPIGASSVSEPLLPQITRTYYDLLAVFEQHMGVSRARYQILVTLGREETSSQAALAQRLRVDSAAITRQVKQLEAEELLTRRADPQDNRFTLVSLTAAGHALADQLLGKRAAFEALATDGLSDDDIAVMLRSLGRIRENLGAARTTPIAGIAATT